MFKNFTVYKLKILAVKFNIYIYTAFKILQSFLEKTGGYNIKLVCKILPSISK